MNEWFRSWHGAPTDPKWRTVAKRAAVPPHLVIAVAWSLMDRASQADSRGSIDGMDIETLADFLGCEGDEIERIIVALHDKGILTSDRFVAWDRRQPKRERDDEGAAERKRQQRSRNAAKSGSGDGGTDDVTPSHATSHQVTPREEERRLDTEKKERGSVLTDGPAVEPKSVVDDLVEPTPEIIAPSKSEDPDAALFRRGRELLGSSAGGQIAKLKRAYGGNVAEARQALEQAATRHDAAEYLAAIIHRSTGQIRGSPPGKRNPFFAALERDRMQ